MSQSGFIDVIQDNTLNFYKIAFYQFSWWKQFQGTKIQIIRITENSKYKSVFGSIANSTLPDDRDAEKIPYTILINMNDLKKIYQKSIDPLTFYDNENTIRIGDILAFNRRDQEYKWKVTDVQTFSEAEGVLYQYTIQGLNEVISK